MRVLPASAYSQRINVEAVELGPYRLPRGTGIVFTPLVTHRLPEVYTEPNRFLPDRWLTLRPSPYAYHPFGAGARMCIGGPLALVIMRVALRRILSRFRLAVVEGTDVSAHVESTMLVPTNGVSMAIHPADGKFACVPVGGNIHELVDLVEVPSAANGRKRRRSAAAALDRLCLPAPGRTHTRRAARRSDSASRCVDVACPRTLSPAFSKTRADATFSRSQ